ncbi:glycosyltransferase [Algoriphagus sp.]|uniref:glycosyltransferase n=1 Tax=Algoriphagus sp. TaxID=1872435 RepID=UPI00263652EE|nr:glycosyltransferase [Algoriphagus sp.]
MRIVQVITRPQRRGAEIFASQLSEQLAKMGHEVFLVSVYQADQELSFDGNLIKLDLPYQGKLDWEGFKHLSQVFRRINPEIVQANASDTLRMCVGASYFFKGRYKLIYRNANQMSGLLKSKFHQFWNQFLLSHVDGIISVSKASKSDLLKTFSFSKPITVIPIGLVPNEIEQKLLKSASVLPKSYILQIGGLVPEKDPLGMLEIFMKLDIPDMHLIFLGSGPLEGELKRQIAAKKLENQILPVVNQANIFPFLSQAKALVLPSKVEGLPGVILEAMYCKVPVIAYDVGGIPEVVINEKTGWLIPYGEQEIFVKALNQILKIEDPKTIPQILNSYQLVTTDFLIPEISEKFLAFYQELFSH